MEKVIRYYRILLTAVSCVLLTALVGNVGLQIIARVFPVRVPMWTEELGNFLLLLIVAVGCGLLFLDKAPIGIDFFFLRLSPRLRKVVYALNVTVACAFSVALAISSVGLVQRGAAMRTPIMRLQYSYFYMAILTAGVLIFVSILFYLYQKQRNSVHESEGDSLS
jgi:TRAP-type C4-dicarboxylate transport system permease small subunit